MHKAPYGFKVFDDRRTLPVWLHRDGGYDTKFVGKYLNGYGRMKRLDGTSSLRYIPPGWTDWRPSVDNARESRVEHLQGGTYRYRDTTISDNGHLEPHQGRYQTFLFSDIVQDMIRDGARGPNPFFIEAAFAAPHVGTPREKDDPKPYHRSDGWKQTWQNPARPKYVRGRFDHRITTIPPVMEAEDFADKPVFMRSQPPLAPEEQEAILEDYHEDARFIGESNVYRGKAQIREFFTAFLAGLPPGAVERFSLKSLQVEGDVAYITWSIADAVPLGTDTFVVKDGLIASQTFAMYAGYAVTPWTASWSCTHSAARAAAGSEARRADSSQAHAQMTRRRYIGTSCRWRCDAASVWSTVS